MNFLFVDTAGWMAMADRKDPLNAAAMAARDLWLEKNGILVTSEDFDRLLKCPLTREDYERIVRLESR